MEYGAKTKAGNKVCTRGVFSVFSRYSISNIRHTAPRGFSLLELLLVIAIIGVIGAAGAGSYRSFTKNIELSTITQSIASDLRQMQARAMKGEGGYKWGMRFIKNTSGNDYYIIFSTDGVNSTTTATTTLSSGISFSDPVSGAKNIVFSKITGVPNESSSSVVDGGTGADGAYSCVSGTCYLNAIDGFTGANGAVPSNVLWTTFTSTGGTVNIQNNMLYISTPSAAPPLSGRVDGQGKQSFSGDFDLSVDFSNFTVSGTNGGIGFEMDDPSNGQVARIQRLGGTSWTNLMHSETNLGGTYNSTSVAYSVTSGGFRIKRSGTTVTTYYKYGGGWVLQATWTGSANPMFPRIFSRNDNTASPVSGSFDNFHNLALNTFNYTTFNISSGATVVLTSMPSVTIKATGNITIAGTLSANGASGTLGTSSTVSGGVFCGGAWTPTVASCGAGGGGAGVSSGSTYRGGGGGGSYGAPGGKGGGATGGAAGAYSAIDSESFGGGGSGADVSGMGGASGGNIKISSSGNVLISGAINANGGAGSAAQSGTKYAGSGGGSGGRIAISGNTISNTGSGITVNGGAGGAGGGAGSVNAAGVGGGGGGAGRVYLYANTITAGTVSLLGGAGGVSSRGNGVSGSGNTVVTGLPSYVSSITPPSATSTSITLDGIVNTINVSASGAIY